MCVTLCLPTCNIPHVNSLSLSLSHRSDKVLLEALLSSLSLLLSRASSRDLLLSWDVFQELFVFLCMLLDGRMSEEAGFGVPTEDRTLRALQALQALLLSATER